MDNTLRSQIIKKIREDILNGKKPGEKLPTERKLADEFGVSRTVIRDAIKTLTGFGLIEVRNREGIYVANVNAETIAKQLSNVLAVNEHSAKSLFQVRLVLETATASWAAESCDENDIKRLKKLIDESQKCKERFSHQSELEESGVKDREFHLLIADISHNPIMIELMKSILAYMRIFSKYTFAIQGRPFDSFKQHEQIFKAIQKRDKEEASKAMQIHIKSVYESILVEIVNRNTLDFHDDNSNLSIKVY